MVCGISVTYRTNKQGAHMAKVSITEAARLVGLSRFQLYRGYIKNGSLSVDRDEKNRPLIDTAELLRVFGSLDGPAQSSHKNAQHIAHNVTPDSHTKNQEELAVCRAMIESYREELARSLDREREALARERWLRERLDTLEQKLLAGPDTKRRWWWPW